MTCEYSCLVPLQVLHTFCFFLKLPKCLKKEKKVTKYLRIHKTVFFSLGRHLPGHTFLVTKMFKKREKGHEIFRNSSECFLLTYLLISHLPGQTVYLFCPRCLCPRAWSSVSIPESCIVGWNREAVLVFRPLWIFLNCLCCLVLCLRERDAGGSFIYIFFNILDSF